MTDQTPLNQLKNAETDAAQIAAIKQLADKLPSETPQESLLQRASALFRQRQQQVKKRAAQQIAAIEFDSWAGDLALGSRKGSLPDRQLLFQSTQLEIDIQITPIQGSDKATVQGQLMVDTPDLAGIELRLTDKNGHTRGRVTDELGSFHFSFCIAGAHELTIALDDGDLVSHFTIYDPSE